MRMVVDFYRSLLRGLSGAPSLAYHDDEDLVDVLCQAWTGDEEHAARCIESTLEGLRFVDANANVATIIDGRIDQLANCQPA